MKDSAQNPKDLAASARAPLDLVPPTLVAMASLAFCEGAAKYGAYNWRRTPVRASVYVAALQRHMSRWHSGEDTDPSTGVPHLASAVACLGILIDAQIARTLIDDRPTAIDMSALLAEIERKVAHVRSTIAEAA